MSQITNLGPLSGGETGDVIGPVSSTDNAIVRFNGITGKIIKNSGVILDNLNNMSGIAILSAAILTLGTLSPDPSAILTVSSTNKGFLPPVMTTMQRDAIPSPATGLTIYNTSSLDLQTYNGVNWIGATSSGVTSVSGIANRTTASPTTGDVVIDISSSYVGQGSITTLGTISTGIWNGTLISGQYGGTGVANTGLTISLATGAVGKVLASDVSGNATWQALSGLGVTSVIGTANRTTASPTTGNVVVDISSSYVGQGSITTLGTISTGIWNGTLISGQYGGTGVANTGLTISLATGAVGKVLASDVSGNATWQALSGLGVTSVIGTANRTTASPTTGNVVVDISSSYVGQGSITTLGTISTGIWNGTLISGQYGGTGIANTGLTISLATGAVGKVLSSDVSGNATWQALSGLGVTSITGTANQISASSPTGAVTLSFTNGISIGSYQSTTPPTGGIIAPGQILFGISTSTAGKQVNITSTLDTNLLLQGTKTGVDAGTNQYGLDIELQFAGTNGAGSVYVISNNCIYAPPSGKTISNIYGYAFFGGINSGAGTILNMTGATFIAPTGGTNSNTALFSTNLALGSYQNTTPPTNGLIVSGNASGFGTSSPPLLNQGPATARGYVSIIGSTDRGVLQLATRAADADALVVGQIEFGTPTNSSGTAPVYRVTGIVGVTDGTTANQRGGALTFFTTASPSGSNSFTEKARLSYNGCLEIGYTVSGATTPANGLIVLGQTGIGLSAPNTNLVVQGASSDFDNVGSLQLRTANPGTGGAPRLAIGIKNSTNAMTYAWMQSIESGVAVRPLVLQNSGGPGVGIGQVVPLSMLDVAGNVAIGSYAGANAAPTNGLIVSGNVGIATTTVAYPLSVNGAIQIMAASGSTFTDTGAALDLFSTGGLYRIGFDSQGGTKGYIRYNVVGSSAISTWGHIFSTSITGSVNSFTNSLFIGANNNVGFCGVTSPQAPMHLLTNGRTAEFRMEGAAADAVDLTFYQNNVLKYQMYVAGSSSILRFNDGTQDVMLMDGNANLVCNASSIATTSTNGFLYIVTCAGAPTGVPTSYTGRVPIIYDTTNNKLWIYNGAWKGAIFL